MTLIKTITGHLRRSHFKYLSTHQRKRASGSSQRLMPCLITSVLIAPVALGQNLNLLMASSSESREAVQQTLQQEQLLDWQITEFDGTDLALVDDIRQRAIQAQLPNAAQIPGATIRRWATLGFIGNVHASAVAGDWSQRLPAVIQQDISYRDQVYAVPTQIHRSNWMWLNTQALQNGEYSQPAPRTWKSFFELMQRNSRGTPSRILTVNDPSQNTLIFEAMVLGLQGSDFYQQALLEYDFKRLKSEQMVAVFEQLAELRPYLHQYRFQSWQAASEALMAGQGDILFAGDWIKPLLSTQGQLATNVQCEPFPESAATFLYNLNSVVLFKDTQAVDQQALAETLFTESLLTELNLREGSIPARLDISPWGFDTCGVRAMREFRSAHRINTLQPSLAAGMAAPEGVQKSVYHVIDSFVDDPSMTPTEGARALAKAIRVALYKI